MHRSSIWRTRRSAAPGFYRPAAQARRLESISMLVLSIAFSVSLGLTLWMVHRSKTSSHRFQDHDLSGPQKFHVVPVPRVGGIGIFVGVVVAVAALWIRQPARGVPARLLRLCALPAFAAGLSLRRRPVSSAIVFSHIASCIHEKCDAFRRVIRD